jgi:hypothetical protein
LASSFPMSASSNMFLSSKVTVSRPTPPVITALVKLTPLR